MSTTDLGESLVGAHMRHIERCTIVAIRGPVGEPLCQPPAVPVKLSRPEEPLPGRDGDLDARTDSGPLYAAHGSLLISPVTQTS